MGFCFVLFCFCPSSVAAKFCLVSGLLQEIFSCPFWRGDRSLLCISAGSWVQRGFLLLPQEQSFSFYLLLEAVELCLVPGGRHNSCSSSYSLRLLLPVRVWWSAQVLCLSLNIAIISSQSFLQALGGSPGKELALECELPLCLGLPEIPNWHPFPYSGFTNTLKYKLILFYPHVWQLPLPPILCRRWNYSLSPYREFWFWSSVHLVALWLPLFDGLKKSYSFVDYPVFLVRVEASLAAFYILRRNRTVSWWFFKNILVPKSLA